MKLRTRVSAVELTNEHDRICNDEKGWVDAILFHEEDSFNELVSIGDSNQGRAKMQMTWVCNFIGVYYMSMDLIVLTTRTPVGDFHMIATREPHPDGGNTDVVILSGFGSLPALKKHLPIDMQKKKMEVIDVHPYIDAVCAYFAGDRRTLKRVHTHQRGSEFHERVWKALEQITFGKTITYKALAEAVGKPKAVRAVGTACGVNDLILLVPCHRVIKSDGTIGKYAYDIKIKQWLLEHEKSTSFT